MHALFVLLGFLACAGHGRGAPLPSGQVAVNSKEEHQSPWKAGNVTNAKSDGAERAPERLKSLAMLLMASNAVNNPGTRVRKPRMSIPVLAMQGLRPSMGNSDAVLLNSVSGVEAEDSHPHKAEVSEPPKKKTRFKKVEGMYLSGFVPGVGGKRYSLEEGKALCLQEEGCSGLTCNKDGTSCTLRRGTELKPSPNDEVSYVKTTEKEKRKPKPVIEPDEPPVAKPPVAKPPVPEPHVAAPPVIKPVKSVSPLEVLQGLSPAALKLLLRCTKLSVCIGAVGYVGVMVRRHRRKLNSKKMEHKLNVRAQKVRAKIDREMELIKKITGARMLERPEGASDSLEDQRDVLAELQARRVIIKEGIVPKLETLYGKSNLKEELNVGGKLLSKRSSTELAELHSSLAERMKAIKALEAEYENIGQAPPRALQTWPLTKIEEHMEDLVGKRTELREVVRLYAKLGRLNVDRSIFGWNADQLRGRVLELSKQVQEIADYEERMKLLGRVEGLMIQRGKETVVNRLGSMSTKELKALLATLQGK